ncbi:MAG: DUF3829 domain-containing protein [Byssovorax sp.]
MRAPHERNARACTAAAALKEPAMGDVDAALGAYAPFVVELSKDIAAANNYYQHEDFKNDAFAKGKELHKKLLEEFGKLDELQDKLGAALVAWRKDHPADGAKTDEGDKESRPAFDAAVSTLLSVVGKTPDKEAFKTNLDKVEKGLEALKAFSQSHPADSWSKIMIGPFDAFLRSAKEVKITDKGVDPDGFLSLVNSMTGLVEARQRAISRAMINKGQTVQPALPAVPPSGAAPAPAATPAATP